MSAWGWTRFQEPPTNGRFLDELNRRMYGLDQALKPIQERFQTDRRESLNVRNFGVACDGIRDDTTAFQFACDQAATMGVPLILPPGATIRTTSVITVTQGPFRLLSNGATISKNHSGRCLDVLPTGVSLGAVTSATTTTITISGAGWTADAFVDDWIDVDHPSSVTNNRRRITANTTDTLTLEYAMDVAPVVGATVTRYTTINGVEIEGVTFTGSTGSDVTNILIDYCTNVVVRDCRSTGSNINGLRIAYGDNVLVSGGDYSSNGAFGVFIYHSDRVRVQGVTCSGNLGDYNIEFKDVRDGVISGCVCQDGERGAAVYCSGLNPSFNVSILGCVTRNGTFPGFQAISQAAEGTTYTLDNWLMQGCQVYDHATGYSIAGTAESGFGAVYDCTAYGCGGIGLLVDNPYTHVKGFRAERCGAQGIRVYADYCTFEDLYLKDNNYGASSNSDELQIATANTVLYTTVRNLTAVKTTTTSKSNRALREMPSFSPNYTTVENVRVIGAQRSTYASDFVRFVGVNSHWSNTGRFTLDGFYNDNLPADYTEDVEMTRGAGRWRAPRQGRIVGLTAALSEDLTGGSVTVRVFKNTGLLGATGTTTGMQVVFNGATTNDASTTDFQEQYVFAAGDEIYLTRTMGSTWSQTTVDLRAAIEVEC